LKSNADEALEIFKWGSRRNIPVIIAPTMISGEGKNAPEVSDAVFKEETLVDLYYEIYSWMIDEGILTIEQVEKEGISPYAGYACNQFITGMFVRQDGVVRACPGNDSEAFRYCKDVRKENLKDVWTDSMGYKIRDELVKTGKLSVTTPCYAKTEGELVKAGSFTEDFYAKVFGKLKQRFEKL
jgi:MoaA/NifB/PqqE/SkfB family radical SAM enzyme